MSLHPGPPPNNKNKASCGGMVAIGAVITLGLTLKMIFRLTDSQMIIATIAVLILGFIIYAKTN